MSFYCPYCGLAREQEWSFCQSCGRRLPEATVAAAATAPEGEGDTVALAADLIQRRAYAEAETLLSQVLAEAPDNASAGALLGNVYLLTNRVSEAKEMLERAAKLAPGSFLVRVKLAEYWYRLGFHKRAADDLEAALAIGTSDPIMRFKVEELLVRARTEARSNFERRPRLPSWGPLRLLRRGKSHRAAVESQLSYEES